jgi:hypothetical protein
VDVDVDVNVDAVRGDYDYVYVYDYGRTWNAQERGPGYAADAFGARSMASARSFSIRVVVVRSTHPSVMLWP